LSAVTVKLAASATAVAAALLLAASAGGNAADASTCSTPAAAANTTVKISVSDFNSSFSAMKKLKPLIKVGRGPIGVLLPDTVSSNRYVRFDAPFLKRAFSTAGLPASKLSVQNALGSDAIQFADAQVDIVEGASVLILDPLDSGVGQAIERYAKQHGVAVIDYDRLTAGGNRRYFVTFNDVAIGKAMGHGLAACVSAWHLKTPKVMIMRGAPTDPNATMMAQGYDSVLAPYSTSGKWNDAANPPGTWTPDVALSEFVQQYKLHPGINAALTPNDQISAPTISYLKGKGIKPKTFPATGSLATVAGLRNVVAGYQCGTAYQPDYLEAQGAAAVALFLRAGLTPPATLLNGRIKDSRSKVNVPSVLFNPVWVTTKNLKSTVIADQYVTVAQLCAAPNATACKAVGL